MRAVVLVAAVLMGACGGGGAELDVDQGDPWTGGAAAAGSGGAQPVTGGAGGALPAAGGASSGGAAGAPMPVGEAGAPGDGGAGGSAGEPLAAGAGGAPDETGGASSTGGVEQTGGAPGSGGAVGTGGRPANGDPGKYYDSLGELRDCPGDYGNCDLKDRNTCETWLGDAHLNCGSCGAGCDVGGRASCVYVGPRYECQYP